MENKNQIQQSSDADRIIDDKYLCEQYGISPTTSWRLRDREHNRIPHFYVGSQVRYRLSEVQKFFDAQVKPKRRKKKAAEPGAAAQ